MLLTEHYQNGLDGWFQFVLRYLVLVVSMDQSSSLQGNFLYAEYSLTRRHDLSVAYKNRGPNR